MRSHTARILTGLALLPLLCGCTHFPLQVTTELLDATQGDPLPTPGASRILQAVHCRDGSYHLLVAYAGGARHHLAYFPPAGSAHSFSRWPSPSALCPPQGDAPLTLDPHPMPAGIPVKVDQVGTEGPRPETVSPVGSRAPGTSPPASVSLYEDRLWLRPWASATARPVASFPHLWRSGAAEVRYRGTNTVARVLGLPFTVPIDAAYDALIGVTAPVWVPLIVLLLRSEGPWPPL